VFYYPLEIRGFSDIVSWRKHPDHNSYYEFIVIVIVKKSD